MPKKAKVTLHPAGTGRIPMKSNWIYPVLNISPLLSIWKTNCNQFPMN